MKKENKAFLTIFGVAVVTTLLVPELKALADAVVLATPSTLPVGVPSVPPIAPAVALVSGTDFFEQVFTLIKSFGGMSFVLKISGVITLIIASMKVSFLQTAWNKFGSFKVFVTPLLSLVLGVLAVLVTGPFSWAAVGSYVFAGGGAVFLHEILDSLKSIPGISGLYLKLIGVATTMLGGNTSQVTPSGSNPS